MNIVGKDLNANSDEASLSGLILWFTIFLSYRI